MAAPRLVGVVHLPPLPGSPRAVEWAAEVAAHAAADARVLADAGFDAIVVENFGDAPFFRGAVPPITVSAMTVCALAAREACGRASLGINVLRNDAEAALAVAHAVGADFVRVNVHVSARVTDQGVVEGEAARTTRTRRALGADHVEIWADVDVKHSSPLAPAPIEREAEEAVLRGMADALLVTGEGTGKAVDARTLDAVRALKLGVPVYVASGATVEQLPVLVGRCDGVIVGSALRDGGKPGGPIAADRAARFARAFRDAFGS
jgi:hypothetical protein